MLRRLLRPRPLPHRRHGRLQLLATAFAVAAFASTAAGQASVPQPSHASYWRRFAAGFASSILAHEAGHVGTALALGKHPSFGFNAGRPTIYSGIDATAQPHQQFLFSAAGLTVQSVLDEGILDVPHDRGAPFERGVLAGGIATTIFYITIGRSGSVSDVDFMSRMSKLSKTDLTLMLGGVAAMHMVRIAHDEHYANFFARPQRDGRMRVGVELR